MPVSEWFTPDAYEATVKWAWWDRHPFAPEIDTMPLGGTGNPPQSAVAGVQFDSDAGYVELKPPNFARAAYVYVAVNETAQYPASADQAYNYTVAEVNASDSMSHLTLPDVEPPAGATVEWEHYEGTWVGDHTFVAEWSVAASAGGGAPGAHLSADLCIVPNAGGNTQDPSTWTKLETLADGDPFTVTAENWDPGTFVNVWSKPGTTGTRTIVQADDLLQLAVRVPETVVPLAEPPGAYPITKPAGTSGLPEPTSWAVYGVAAQVDAIGVRRLYQPPRYRFVYPDPPITGMWRLRQRQSAGAADGWSLRHRQNSNMSGSWPLRQRQDET